MSEPLLVVTSALVNTINNEPTERPARIDNVCKTTDKPRGSGSPHKGKLKGTSRRSTWPKTKQHLLRIIDIKMFIIILSG